MVKVEIGGGEHPRKDYINCDLRKLSTVNHVCEAWNLPFIDDSIDEIYTRHSLEHYTYLHALQAFTEWKRVLVDGGLLHIVVPDLEYHMDQLKKAGESKYARNKSNLQHALAGFYGWQKHAEDYHRWGWTFTTIENELTIANFINIKRIKCRECDLEVICNK